MNTKKGKLYIVATPIGNLEDITYRAVKILSEVSLIVCEDTRTTTKLCSYYNIETKRISANHHASNAKLSKIIQNTLKGEDIAYVSDAGTPGLSDPGNQIVKTALDYNIEVVPIPGASALTSIVSIAGIDMQKFCFLAFPPHKKGRKTFFEKIANSDIPVIYYDSVHRIIKNLRFLQELKSDVYLIVGRELTKKFEQVLRGNILSIIEYFEKNKDKNKGEFVIIVK